jgi:acyl carrier protein
VTRQEVIEDLLAFLQDYLGVVGVTRSTRLLDEAGLDSVAVGELAAFVELRWRVRIPDHLLTVEHMATAGHLADLILRLDHE